MIVVILAVCSANVVGPGGYGTTCPSGGGLLHVLIRMYVLYSSRKGVVRVVYCD